MSLVPPSAEINLGPLASPNSEPLTSLRVAEVVSALSQALDLGSGSTRWHSVRTCVLGMRIAAELRLPVEVQTDLYYALLLKDAGCSSNASQIYNALGSDDIAAKREVKKTDSTRMGWESIRYAVTHVAPDRPILERVRAILRMALTQKEQTREVTAIRCERGASMARLMGLTEGTATAIGGLDEHWNGAGHPYGLTGKTIPATSRIMLLAQTLDIFYKSVGHEQALKVVQERSGRWFDPEMVRAVSSLAKRNKLWSYLDTEEPLNLVLALEPKEKLLSEGNVSLDAVCQAFGQIVDAKSPFTYNHSNGVANTAVRLAQKMGLPSERVLFLRHAGLLHDVGKMAVSNAILEKPGKPDESEWQVLMAHPSHTWTILRSISGFEQMSDIAAAHHEKLNGKGYHLGLTGTQLPLEARILVVADIFDALTAKRPYRDSLPIERVFEIMQQEAPHALDASCLDALVQSGATADQSVSNLDALQQVLDDSDERSRAASLQSAEALALRYAEGVYE